MNHTSRLCEFSGKDQSVQGSSLRGKVNLRSGGDGEGELGHCVLVHGEQGGVQPQRLLATLTQKMDAAKVGHSASERLNWRNSCVILYEYPKLDLAPGAGPLHLHSLGIHLLDETTRQGSRLRHSLA